MKITEINTMDTPLAGGELYLFHKSERSCPCDSSLWGTVDEICHGIVHLESSSCDLQNFDLWHILPDGYTFCRPATAAEIRDYFFNFGYYSKK